MLPCCIERPFRASQAVDPDNRRVLVGTIQAQIFGHHGRGDPAKLRIRIVGLQPVERRGGVGQLAFAAVEAALAAPYSTKIEAQGRKTAAHKALVQGVDDLVVHRAAMLGMRMEHERHRGRRHARMVIAPLDPALRTIDDHIRHDRSNSYPSCRVGQSRPQGQLMLSIS